MEETKKRMPSERLGKGRCPMNKGAFEATWMGLGRFVQKIGEPTETDDDEFPVPVPKVQYQVPDQDVRKKAIKVKKIEMNIESNTKTHRTDEFDITDVKKEKPSLVVRRGQPFDLSVVFNRVYDETKDDLRIVFKLGDTPNPSKGTHVGFMLSAKDIPKKWGGFIKKTDGNTLHLKINTPPYIPIGKWRLSIDVMTGVSVESYLESNPIYMLFNPWCKDDQVYIPEEHLKREYILNETGTIFVGSKKRISGRKWTFGQFEEDVLDCCLYLLDKSTMQDHAKGDPVKVCRQLLAMINSSDDNGVLTGNWSGKYPAGKSPVSWAGSVTILQQYYKEKKPVKYGQCWVFSGVLTTVCRALGIPTRSVTNFESAHDSDGSETIDYHFGADYNKLEDLDCDSLWKFHVWNDVWMTRPDLPLGYGGWQAIDATPQETNDGIYCMGPMSLLAIKRGELNMPHDGRLAFAEVNADKRYMVLDEKTMKFKCVYMEKDAVGINISTKRPKTLSTPDSEYVEKEDITDQYKFREGSEAERISVLKDKYLKKKMLDEYGATKKDVDFKIRLNSDTFMGDDILVDLEMKNNSSETRTVNGRITLSSIYYTGFQSKVIAVEPLQNCMIKPNSEKTVSMFIPVNDHMEETMDHCFFRVSCMTRVLETKQIFTKMTETRLRKPHLTIKAPAKTTVGEKFNVDVSFTNPMPMTLTGCELVVEGPGLKQPDSFALDNVGAKQTFVGNLTLTKKKVGDKEIVINFNSKQLMGVNGFHKITVTK